MHIPLTFFYSFPVLLINTENLLNNQELLKLVIVSFILMGDQERISPYDINTISTR